MRKLKAGIITIHKIKNYGSALQAFALQDFLERKIGWNVEIIDYKFPNAFHRSHRYKGIKKRIRMMLHDFKVNNPLYNKLQKKRFRHFWKTYLHLTSKKYASPKALKAEHFDYDIFLTGSDQVWNPNTLCGDTIMMLDFAENNNKRFAYGASFSVTALPTQFIELYKNNLSKYISIGVREKSGISILKDLGISTNIELVCDPTLLLTKEEYTPLVQSCSIKLPEHPYILVYCLGYAFNPMPKILHVLNEVQSNTGYNVIFINNVIEGFQGKYLHYKNIGPCEFAALFAYSSFVITSSFHGTAFSVINRKPFYAITPRTKDSRISDFLIFLGLQSRIMYTDSDKKAEKNCDIYTDEIESKINSLRNHSINFLKRIDEYCKQQ